MNTQQHQPVYVGAGPGAYQPVYAPSHMYTNAYPVQTMAPQPMVMMQPVMVQQYSDGYDQVAVTSQGNGNLIEIVHEERNLCAQIFVSCFFPVFIGIAVFMACFVGGRTGSIVFIVVPSFMVFISLFGFVMVIRRFYRETEHAVVDMAAAQMHVVHGGYLCINPHWEEDINLRDCKSYSVRAQQRKRGTYWYLDLHMNNGDCLDFSIGESTSMIVQGTLDKIKIAMARCGVNDGSAHTAFVGYY